MLKGSLAKGHWPLTTKVSNCSIFHLKFRECNFQVVHLVVDDATCILVIKVCWKAR
jgi:hypothetical protein